MSKRRFLHAECVAMFVFCWEDSSESEMSQHCCLLQFGFTHHLYLHTFISLLYYHLRTSEDIWWRWRQEMGMGKWGLLSPGFWYTVSERILPDGSSMLSITQLNETHVKWLYISISAYFSMSAVHGSRGDGQLSCCMEMRPVLQRNLEEK